jgi:hypothetical protein
MTPATPVAVPTTIPQDLIQEIDEFRKCCHSRYRFNSFWDNVLNTLSMGVALGIIACGIYNRPALSAMLGGVMTALVSAQRAFPFNQRWQFYRLLNSQAENLLTDTRQGVITLQQAVTTLKAMRLDFAQQIPRGSSLQQPDSAGASDGGAPKGPDGEATPERSRSAAAGSQAATGTGSNTSSSVAGS